MPRLLEQKLTGLLLSELAVAGEHDDGGQWRPLGEHR